MTLALILLLPPLAVLIYFALQALNVAPRPDPQVQTAGYIGGALCVVVSAILLLTSAPQAPAPVAAPTPTPAAVAETAPPPMQALQAAPTPPDEWAAWGDNFRTVMAECVAAKRENCLDEAFKSRPRPAATGAAQVTEELYRDVRAADIMLNVKESSDALWHDFGIDSKSFLGTGHSVPLGADGTPAPYDSARQREVLVPNFCAETLDAQLCPKAQAELWTWRLSDADARAWLGKPLRALLTTQETVGGGAFPTDAIARGYIRIGRFNSEFYRGQLGKPGARRVFFADLSQVADTTLQDEMVATGSPALTGDVDPAKTLFVWVYAPRSKSQAEVASWRTVFHIMETSAAH